MMSSRKNAQTLKGKKNFLILLFLWKTPDFIICILHSFQSIRNHIYWHFTSHLASSLAFCNSCWRNRSLSSSAVLLTVTFSNLSKSTNLPNFNICIFFTFSSSSLIWKKCCFCEHYQEAERLDWPVVWKSCRLRCLPNGDFPKLIVNQYKLFSDLTVRRLRFAQHYTYRNP